MSFKITRIIMGSFLTIFGRMLDPRSLRGWEKTQHASPEPVLEAYLEAVAAGDVLVQWQLTRHDGKTNMVPNPEPHEQEIRSILLISAGECEVDLEEYERDYNAKTAVPLRYIVHRDGEVIEKTAIMVQPEDGQWKIAELVW